MRAVVLRSLAVVGVGAVILVGVLYIASTVDARAPTVVQVRLTQPLPDEPSRALITTSLEVEFTEPVDPESAVDAVTIDPAVDGSTSWSGSTMIFTPVDPLELATSYTVEVAAGIEDLAGNAMTELPGPFTFETAGSPEVVETVPVDGTVGVALDTPISITFSTLMDTASVEAALRVQPAFAHELRWSGRLLEILPAEALDPEREYEVTIGDGAFDVSGVAIETPISVAFSTVATGLEASRLVPRDGTDGIAPTTPIAVVFDRGIDPDSVSDDRLTIEPAVAGTLELVDANGDEPADPSEARVLRFAPSGPLEANTTFEVVLQPGVASLDGGGITQPISWTFTTGAPLTRLSNVVTFLSDRGGVSNLWAMNVDGTAPRQLSTELSPVLDYAVAPDGSSFVVGDGRRLVLVGADGGDRRVLTADGDLEFDPAYAPNSQRIAFARRDAESGLGLGLWERLIEGGDAVPITVTPDPDASPAPTPSGSPEAASNWMRAPRYAPDGSALAFIDPTGWVGIIEREDGSLTRAPFDAQTPPAWLPDGTAILVSGRRSEENDDAPRLEPLIAPIEPGRGLVTSILERSGSELEEGGFGTGATVLAIAPDGQIAYVRDDGSLHVTDDPAEIGPVPVGLIGQRVRAAAFAPGEAALVVAILAPSGQDPDAGGRIERVFLDGRGRDILSNDGRRPRWLP